jgi:hypothetical protein
MLEGSKMELGRCSAFEDLVAGKGMEGKVKQGKIERRINLVKWS